MSEYVRVERARARRPRPATAESSLWRRFQQPVVFRHKAAPTHIEFCPLAPYDFCVASSLQVDIFSSRTRSIYRTLTRFKDIVRCASYRADGKILATGDEQGAVQVFDLNSRAVMRTFSGHERSARVVRFSPDGSQLFTASDDAKAIQWDVASESRLATLEGHTDFIRSGALSTTSPSQMLITGSYDHTVRLWDVSSGKNVMTLRHNAPVEAVAILPGGGMLAAAAGNAVSIWDLLGGGRLLHAACAHSKTVTSLAVDASAGHLLSGSLDHSVKAYELSRYKVVGAVKYAAPVLSLAIAPDLTTLVAGMSDNSLCVRRQRAAIAAREAAQADVPPANVAASPFKPAGRPGQVAVGPGVADGYGGTHPGSYRYFLRGRTHAPQSDDLVAERGHNRRLAGYDKALRAFRYHEALDAVLQAPHPPLELIMTSRGAPTAALSVAVTSWRRAVRSRRSSA